MYIPKKIKNICSPTKLYMSTHYSTILIRQKVGKKKQLINEFTRCGAYVHAKSLQSCLTLCDPMDNSPPSSSVHGILQAKIPEYVAMPSSRRCSQLREGSNPSLLCLLRWQVGSSLLVPPGKPTKCCISIQWTNVHPKKE